MPHRDQLRALDLADAARGLRAGELTAVELGTAYLRRIEQTESFNAWVTVDADGALAAAALADEELASGLDRGPLHGIPVGVKDLVDTAGLRTTYGSGRFRDHVPSADAVVVGRLRDSGAVILGKHATHEFAWGGRTDSPHFGPTRNPHDAERIPGGSSGGGAASVMLGSCLLAVGSDTAGSVRIPAALSGCVGLKPSRDWLSLDGVFPLAPSLDHLGLLARSVPDVATAWRCLSGATREPATPANELTVGVLTGAAAAHLDPSVTAAVASARRRLEQAGVPVREIEDPTVDERVTAVLTLIRGEAEQVHRSAYAADPGSYGPDLAALLALGAVSEAETAAARAVVDRAQAWLDDALTEVDLLLGATVPVTAPRIGALHHRRGDREIPIEFVLTRLTSLANATGVPALSVPGEPSGGLPVGVQLMARLGAERDLLSIGSLLSS